MHLFLTGAIQSGKSSAINKALRATGTEPSGFRTVAGAPDENGGAPLYIVPATGCAHTGEHNCVARRSDPGRGFEVFTGVFDTVGAEILRKSGGGLILMDELGFMETKAEAFKAEVFRLLDGDTPILGVVRGKKTDFLDAVRVHPKVTLMRLDEGNREEIAKEITAWLAGLKL